MSALHGLGPGRGGSVAFAARNAQQLQEQLAAQGAPSLSDPPLPEAGHAVFQHVLVSHAQALRVYLDEWANEQQRLMETELGPVARTVPAVLAPAGMSLDVLPGGFGVGDLPIDFGEPSDLDLQSNALMPRSASRQSHRDLMPRSASRQSHRDLVPRSASRQSHRDLMPRSASRQSHRDLMPRSASRQSHREVSAVPEVARYGNALPLEFGRFDLHIDLPACEDGVFHGVDGDPEQGRPQLVPRQVSFDSASMLSEASSPKQDGSFGLAKAQALMMLGKKEEKRKGLKTKDVFSDTHARSWEDPKSVRSEMHQPLSATCIESSNLFNLVCNLMIVANTVLLSILIERQANGLVRERVLEDLDMCFTIFYAGELLLRLVVHRLHFFYGQDSKWRWLDLMLVASSVSELVGQQIGTGMNIKYFRILRLLKIMKVLRMLRVMRSLREIRILLDSILGAVRSIFWSVVLMICTTFMFALCFMQAATTGSESVARQPWSSISSSMAALFAAASGGVDWVDLADPLYRDGEHYYIIFFFYIGFFLFVLNNAMTSLFVQKLLANVANDETFMVEDRLIRKSEYTRQIASLFKKMDADGDGQVSFEDLCLSLHEKEMSSFAASLDIEEADLTACFSIITSNGTYRIDLENFVTGCIKLRGMAKSVDIIDVAIAQNHMAEKLNKLCEEHAHLRSSLLRDEGWAAGNGVKQSCTNSASNWAGHPGAPP